jgi:hypothetical protein
MLHAVACLVTAAFLAAGSVPSRPIPGPGIPISRSRVLGQVIDARTRAGIGAVRVRLDDGASETTTGPDGAFEFQDVAPGRHHVSAVLEGFAPSPSVTVVVEPDTDARVEIEYSLGMSTEVRATPPPSPAVPPPASLGSAELTGLQVASAVGGLDDLMRVMQLRPGIAASQDDRNDLMVRGGGAMETSVRIDGFEVPTASHFAWPGGASGGLSLIPSAVIDRAAVETSGFSVAYGERASALLDVDTRKGATDRIHGRADVSAAGVLALAEGRLPGAGGQSGSWMASARRSILEVAFTHGDSRAIPGYVEVMGNVDVPLSKRHRLHVLGLESQDTLDVSWSASSQDSLDGNQALHVAGVSLRSAWTPRTETVLSTSWASNELTLREPDVTATSFTNHSRERFLRTRAEIRQVLAPDVRVLAGVAVRRSGVEYELQDGAYRNEWGILVPPVRSVWHDEFTNVAAYAEASWTRGPVALSGGVRADHSGLTSSWYGSPRARVEYRPGSRWRLLGTLGDYRQDIANIWIGSNVANKLLDPVQCIQATAGVEGALSSGLMVTAEGFWKRYDGYPIDPSVPSRVLISAGADFESPLVGKLVPSGLVHADGVDVSLAQRLFQAVTLSAAYSYWDVSEYNLEKKWIRADYDIRHQARIWLVWHRAKRWTASALWRYTSGRPYTPYDVAASIKANAGRLDTKKTNAVTYPAYHRLDLRAERLFLSRHAAITAFVEVDNVYDHDNVYTYNWSKALKAPQPTYQWGLTPVAGVRVEF